MHPQIIICMKNIPKQVAEIQTLIDQAIKDDVGAIEVDSTWESMYWFINITLSKSRITVQYTEWNGNCVKTKPITDYVNLVADSKIEYTDTMYMLSWIRRCIKKGYKQANLEQIKQTKEDN